MIKSELVQKIAEKNPHLYHRDIERIVKDFADYGALSITPIGTPLSTDKAMRKRVEEIEKNRQLMGI